MSVDRAASCTSSFPYTISRRELPAHLILATFHRTEVFLGLLLIRRLTNFYDAEVSFGLFALEFLNCMRLIPLFFSVYPPVFPLFFVFLRPSPALLTREILWPSMVPLSGELIAAQCVDFSSPFLIYRRTRCSSFSSPCDLCRGFPKSRPSFCFDFPLPCQSFPKSLALLLFFFSNGCPFDPPFSSPLPSCPFNCQGKLTDLPEITLPPRQVLVFPNHRIFLAFPFFPRLLVQSSGLRGLPP